MYLFTCRLFTGGKLVLYCHLGKDFQGDFDDLTEKLQVSSHKIQETTPRIG